jgi:hypothetical protein
MRSDPLVYTFYDFLDRGVGHGHDVVPASDTATVHDVHSLETDDFLVVMIPDRRDLVGISFLLESIRPDKVRLRSMTQAQYAVDIPTDVLQPLADKGQLRHLATDSTERYKSTSLVDWAAAAAAPLMLPPGMDPDPASARHTPFQKWLLHDAPVKTLRVEHRPQDLRRDEAGVYCYPPNVYSYVLTPSGDFCIDFRVKEAGGGGYVLETVNGWAPQQVHVSQKELAALLLAGIVREVRPPQEEEEEEVDTEFVFKTEPTTLRRRVVIHSFPDAPPISATATATATATSRTSALTLMPAPGVPLDHPVLGPVRLSEWMNTPEVSSWTLNASKGPPQEEFKAAGDPAHLKPDARVWVAIPHLTPGPRVLPLIFKDVVEGIVRFVTWKQPAMEVRTRTTTYQDLVKSGLLTQIR